MTFTLVVAIGFSMIYFYFQYRKNRLLRTPHIHKIIQEYKIKPKHFIKLYQETLLLDPVQKCLWCVKEHSVQNFKLDKLSSTKVHLVQNKDDQVISCILNLQFEDNQIKEISFYQASHDDDFDKRWLLLQVYEWKKFIDKQRGV
jgi:hypothetical protein